MACCSRIPLVGPVWAARQVLAAMDLAEEPVEEPVELVVVEPRQTDRTTTEAAVVVVAVAVEHQMESAETEGHSRHLEWWWMSQWT